MIDPHNRVGRRRRGEAGFTLIELLVVIAILSVLAAIVILNVTGVKNTANAAACNTDQQVLQTASDTFWVDTGAYATLINALVPQYVHTLPHDVDQSGGTVTWIINTTTGVVSGSPTCSS
jgi:prepilin-type N-terminal cleavage/methylation domain-containing protein